MAADGTIVHNAGGSEAQELAYVLAAVLRICARWKPRAFRLMPLRRMIYFRLSGRCGPILDASRKFRALRKLWARIEEGLRT